MTRYTPLWLQNGTYPASVDRRLLAALWPAPASTGCAVTAGSGMTVNVAPGTVAVPSQNATGSTLCTSDAVEAVTLAAAPGSGTSRIDLVICQPRGNDLDGGSNNDFVFAAVTGTAASTPTAPAVPAGSVALAQILVPGGSASVTAGNITDARPAMLNGSAEPATASATIVSRTDVTGEVWVAKAGVNGGAWKKARDVLHVAMRRTAAFTISTTAAALGWDITDNDPYAMCLGMTSPYTTTLPIAGIWQVTFRLAATPTATGQWISASVAGAPSGCTAMAHASNTQILSLTLAKSWPIPAGSALSAQISASISLAGGAGGPYTAWNVDYLGTG